MFYEIFLQSLTMVISELWAAAYTFLCSHFFMGLVHGAGVCSASQMWLLYRGSVLRNNSRDSVKIELWDGPAPNSRRTFFQKSLLSGIGVDDALSFVTSLGASLAAACCGAVGSGPFVFCLVIWGSWVEGTFLSDFTEVTSCCSVL